MELRKRRGGDDGESVGAMVNGGGSPETMVGRKCGGWEEEDEVEEDGKGGND